MFSLSPALKTVSKMAIAIEIKGIAPDKTLEICARQIIVSYFHEMMSHKAGAIEGVDIEFVHDMRVASRRLRAAMDNFAACFEKEPFKKHYKQIRTITRTMGAVRDLDVLITRFQRELQTLPAVEQGDIQGLVEHLQQERKKARKPMLNLFTELDASDFEIQFLAFFEAEA